MVAWLCHFSLIFFASWNIPGQTVVRPFRSSVGGQPRFEECSQTLGRASPSIIARALPQSGRRLEMDDVHVVTGDWIYPGRENCSDDLGPWRRMAERLHSGACLESALHLFCPGDAQSGPDAVPGAARQAPSAAGLALALPRWPHVCGRRQAATPSPWGLLFTRAESFLLRTL